MNPHRFKKLPAGVSDQMFGEMIGNSMSVNCVEAVLVMINKVAPGVMNVGPLTDLWSLKA